MRMLIVSSVAAAAALFAAVPASAQQSAPFCLRGTTGNMNCSFQTMAQCQQSMKGVANTGTCVANPQTTGQGGAPKSNMAPPGRAAPPAGR